MYVIKEFENYAQNPYVLAYCHTETSFLTRPRFSWLFSMYNVLPRPYKKNLKQLHVIHPSMLVRIFFALSRPFVSKKFWDKLVYYQPDIFEGELASQISPLEVAQVLPPFVLDANTLMTAKKKKLRIPTPPTLTLFGGPLALSVQKAESRDDIPVICTDCLAVLRSDRPCGINQGYFRVPGDRLSITGLRKRYQDRFAATTSSSKSNNNTTTTTSSFDPDGDDDVTRETDAESSSSTTSSHHTLLREGEDVHVVASLFREYVRDLPEPLIPFAQCRDCLELGQLLREERTEDDSLDEDRVLDNAWAVLNGIPKINQRLLRPILHMCHDIADKHKLNARTSRNLATCFAPTLLRPERATHETLLSDTPVAIDCMAFFIEHGYDLFPKE